MQKILSGGKVNVCHTATFLMASVVWFLLK